MQSEEKAQKPSFIIDEDFGENVCCFPIPDGTSWKHFYGSMEIFLPSISYTIFSGELGKMVAQGPLSY